MPIGAMKHAYYYQQPTGGGGIGTTTLFTLNNAISGVYSGGYGGYGDSQITWQGTFNTNYGVFLVTWLNSARNAYYITPGVIDLTTGTMAMGSNVSIATANTGATTGFCVAAKPDSTFGLVAGPHWNGSDWDGHYRGYTLTGTSTATTSSIPTVSLSTALVDTQNNFFSGNIAYAGNNRFVFVNRYGPGDLSVSHYISYAGSGTPSYFHSTVNYGTSRSTGRTISFYDGLSSTLASSFSNTHGNNNNFTDLYVTCASSSAEAEFEDQNRLDCDPANGISGGFFTAAKAYDTSGTWVGISGLQSTQEGQKLVAEKCTTLSSSSVVVSSGAVLSPAYTVQSMDQIDPTTGLVRAVVANGTGTWMSDITVNSSTLAVTFGTPYQVDSTTYAVTEANLRNHVDPTHGEWSLWAQNQGSNNLRMIAVKVV